MSDNKPETNREITVTVYVALNGSPLFPLDQTTLTDRDTAFPTMAALLRDLSRNEELHNGGWNNDRPRGADYAIFAQTDHDPIYPLGQGHVAPGDDVGKTMAAAFEELAGEFERFDAMRRHPASGDLFGSAPLFGSGVFTGDPELDSILAQIIAEAEAAGGGSVEVIGDLQGNTQTSN